MSLERIVYLTEANYSTLVSNGTVTANGQTVTYSNNDLYITPLGVSTVLNGGTGVSSLTANQILMSGNSTTAPITTREVTNNSTSSTAISGNTNIPTMNTLYNALVKVNNADQKHSVGIFAPITAGTANYILVSAGGNNAPTWKATAKGAVYVTTANGALTFATLPVGYGGTGTDTAPTQYGIIYASTNAKYASTTAGTSGQYLKSNGTSAPTWTSFTNATTSTAGLMSSTDKQKLDNAVPLIASNVVSSIISGANNVEDALSSLNTQVTSLVSQAGTLTTNVGTLTTNLGTATTNITNLQALTNNQVLITDTTIAIPAYGNTISKDLPGLTAEHYLVQWNFSSSADDKPPVSLTWTTYDGYFTITNNAGSTNQTIKPIFAKPLAKTVSDHT